MAKKKKKNIEPVETTIKLSSKEINTLLEKYLAKYTKYEVIDEDFIKKILDNTNLKDENYSLDIGIILDRAVTLYLCKQITDEGNDEYLFLLEEDYHNVFMMILRKLNCPNEIIDHALEDIFLDLVDKYDGSDTFAIIFTRLAKKYIADFKKKEMTQKLNGLIEKLPVIAKNNTINDLNFIGNQLQFIIDLPLDDEMFVKFVAYKYGFVGYYASEEAIKKELHLDNETYYQYLLKSYHFFNHKLREQLGYVTKNDQEYQKMKTS